MRPGGRKGQNVTYGGPSSGAAIPSRAAADASCGGVCCHLSESITPEGCGGVPDEYAEQDGCAVPHGCVSRLDALGWKPKVALTEGVAATSRWYVDKVASREGARA